MFKLLQRQQAIMSVLGLYSGRCDGAWGPDTVAAKVEWESRDDFEPAVISRGAPFYPGCKLPKGFMWLGGNITVKRLKEEDIQAAITKSGGLLTATEVDTHVFPKETKPVVQEKVAEVKPSATQAQQANQKS